MIFTVFRISGMLVLVYLLLCMLRIMLSWFGRAALGPAGRPLVLITEPYLNFFRRFTWLRNSQLDFSPIAAMAVLGVLSRLLSIMGDAGRFSLGIVLGLLLGGIASFGTSILDLFIILMLVRLLIFFFRWNSLHPACLFVDTVINPLIFRIKSMVFKNRIVHYRTGIIVALAFVTVFRILLSLSAGLLVPLLMNLPF